MELEWRLCVADVMNGSVGVASINIEQCQVPLTECAADGVLTHEPQRDPFYQEAGKCKRFRVRPIDAAIPGKDVAAAVQPSPQLLVHREAAGDGES